MASTCGVASLGGSNSNPVSAANSQNSAALSPAQIKLRKAAGDFESLLLNSLWKSMKQTFGDEQDDDADPTLETFDDWGMQAMSSAMGSADGLGIKRLIIEHLEPSRSSQGSAAAANQCGPIRPART